MRQAPSIAEMRAAFQGSDLSNRFPPVLSAERFAELMGVELAIVTTWLREGRLEGATNRIGDAVFIWRDRAVALMFRNERNSAPSHTTLKCTAPSMPSRGKTVTAAIHEFLQAKRVEARAVKTLEKYDNQLTCFEAFASRNGCQRLSEITMRLFDGYRLTQSQRVSPKSLYSDSITIKSFVRWCVNRDYLSKNPLAAIQLVKPPPRASYVPTSGELRDILQRASSHDRAILALLAMTGLRAGEMRMLRPSDIRIDAGFVHVVSRAEWRTKSGQSRKVALHPALAAALRTVPGDPSRPYFFTVPLLRRARMTRPVYFKTLNLRFQALASARGLPIGHNQEGVVLHSLRHFFETECVNAGVPQLMIDRWMGHTSGKLMSRLYYAMRDQEALRFIANVPFHELLLGEEGVTQP